MERRASGEVKVDGNGRGSIQLKSFMLKTSGKHDIDLSLKMGAHKGV